MMKFLSLNLHYPDSARTGGVEGTVWATFIVDTDGTINDPQIIRSLCRECDAEALRVIRKMPNWIPGRQRNIAVPVQYNVPIQFKIQ